MRRKIYVTGASPKLPGLLSFSALFTPTLPRQTSRLCSFTTSLLRSTGRRTRSSLSSPNEILYRSSWKPARWIGMTLRGYLGWMIPTVSRIACCYPSPIDPRSMSTGRSICQTTKKWSTASSKVDTLVSPACSMWYWGEVNFAARAGPTNRHLHSSLSLDQSSHY